MVYAFAAKQHRPLCWHQLEHSVLRNFGGLDTVDPVQIFKDHVTTLYKGEEVSIGFLFSRIMLSMFL